MTFTGDAPSADDDQPHFKFQVRLYTFRTTPYSDDEIAEFVDTTEGSGEGDADGEPDVKVVIEETFV